MISYTLFFLLLAAFHLLMIMWMCRKYSEDYWFSIFLFVASTDYLSWTFNGIRQFTAVVIVYAATPFILKKKYIPSILLVLLASTMHQSALLMIPIVLMIQGKAWNKKTVFCIFASLAVLLFIDQFTNIMDSMLTETQYKNVVGDYQLTMMDQSTSCFRVFYSGNFIIDWIKQIRAENDPIINIAAGAGAAACGLYIISAVTSGLFLGRLPIYVSVWSQCILLPWEIKHIFTERSARLMKTIAVICYCFFFYYQMHFAWKIL